MRDADEQQWVCATANELNNLLQVISNSSQVLEGLCGATPEADKYFAILRSGVERAAATTQLMVDRVERREQRPAPPAPVRAFAPTPAVGVAKPPALVPKAPAPGAAQVNIQNSGGHRELVMIVDDEDFVTMLAQRVLSDEGYRVVTAKDGFQAIATYEKLRDEISLIILDFTMPVMDGADVFEELLRINPKVSVVLSSGFAEQSRLRNMLARGLRGFMPKPYTQQKLLTQIRSTLDALHSEKTGERRVL